MPAPRFRRQRQVGIRDGQLFHLATGWDFFDDGYGRNPDEKTLAQMRRDWFTYKHEVIEATRQNWANEPDRKPWAEIEFGESADD